MSTLLVTAALIESEGKILLARRRAHVPYPLLWEFPGGKVEAGEDPGECIVREVREELGVEVAVDGIYEVLFHRYPERDVLLLVYRCRWLNGDIQDLEVLEHRWVPPADLEKCELLPADIPLARKIAEEYGRGDTAGL